MTPYPDFRRDRLTNFIPSRFFLAFLVTVVVFVAWRFSPSDELRKFLLTCLLASSTGLVYWLLFKLNYFRLTALIFAPLDFIIITMAIAVTNGASGGLLIFHLWSVITAGMILGPTISIVFGALSVAVAGLSAATVDHSTSVPRTFELFHSLGIVVITLITYVLIRRLDQTLIEQQALRGQLELERDRLDVEVARRTEELVLANRALDNRNTMLSLQRRQAEEANRLKSQFLANMSHELRTPLNAINGFADLMLQGIYGSVTSKQQERLGNIMSRAKDLLSLINDVLDMAKLEAGRLDLDYTGFDPTDAIRDVRETIEPLLRIKGERLSLILESPETPIRVICDRERYKQILLNLVSNAFKFTEEGAVTITLEEGPVGHFITHVKDTGIGIKQEDQDRIFEPFEQLDGGPSRRYGGMGLGLYICRQLATLLRGSIQVSSELRHGSRFSVVLPQQAPMDLQERMLMIGGGEGGEHDGWPGPEAFKRHIAELEKQIRQANQQLRGVFDHSPLPMFLYDQQGNLLLWNRACEVLADMLRTPSSKHTVQDAFYPAAKEIITHLIELVSRGFICRMAWHGTDAADRSIVRVGLHYPVLNEHGGVVYVVGIFLEPGPFPIDETVQILHHAEQKLAIDSAFNVSVGAVASAHVRRGALQS